MSGPLTRLATVALRRPRLTVALALLSAVACVAAAAGGLSLNSDENDLFSGQIELAGRRAIYYEALPALADPIIVVIEAGDGSAPAGGIGDRARPIRCGPRGPSAAGVRPSSRQGRIHSVSPRPAAGSPCSDTRAAGDALDAVADALAAEAVRRPSLFRAVYGWPGQEFRRRQGALYLPEPELAALLEHIVTAQPVLGALSREPGLAGLLRTLTRAVTHARSGGGASVVDGSGEPAARLWPVMDGVARTFEAWRRGAPGAMDWGAGIAPLAGAAAHQRRILFLLPVVDYASMDPAGPAVAALRETIRDLPEVAAGEVSVRLTGVPVLAHEDGEHVAAQAGVAGAASLLLVLAVLARGLGSWRMLGAVAATLLVGIAWTVGLATALVGHLNVISIAFGVLAIGLGVDFAIHFALRFSEAHPGTGTEEALRRAARASAAPLTLCAATTALAMLAFAPTHFTAMAELGVIMAGGMAACLLATFTVLPALLAGARAHVVTAPPATVRAAARLVERWPRATLSAFAVLALIAGACLPQLRFDANPLSVRDPGADSVKVLEELLAEGDGITWNMNVLVPPGAEAEEAARRLRALDSVADVRTGAHYLPQEQARKLERIDTAALAAPPAAAPGARPPVDVAQVRAALLALAKASDDARGPGGQPDPQGGAGARLAQEARAAAHALDTPGAAGAAAGLESRLLDGLQRELAAVQGIFEATALSLDSLPPEIAALARARDGRERLEVLPAGDLTDRAQLERFVEQVLEVAPGAYGEAFVIHRLGSLVVDAFGLASALSFCAVVGLVALAHRSLRATTLVALPLLLACGLTLGAAAALGIALDFANVIVLPLLLGIGVDTSIHLVHRALETDGQGPILESHTARAVLLSGLTTLASFGALALSRHLGLASLGQLLCLGLLCVLAVNLLFLPALLRVTGGRDAAALRGYS